LGLLEPRICRPRRLDARGPGRRRTEPTIGGSRGILRCHASCLGSQIDAFARDHRWIFGCEIGQHRRQRRVGLEIIEDDLVVRVAVGVPGIVAIIPVERAQSEGWKSVATEGEVIASAASGESRTVELDLLLKYGWDLGQPLLNVDSGVRKAGAAHTNDAAGSVVLIEQSLKTLENFRMIFGKGLRSYFALLLAAPVAHENRALGMRIYLLEDPHGFQHGDGAGSVVGRAGGAIPRIEVRREHHVLIWLLGSLVLGDREDEAVVLAAQCDCRRPGVVGLEHFDRPPAILGTRCDETGNSAFFQTLAELAAAERKAVAGSADVATAPLGVDGRAEAVHACPGFGSRVRCPILTRPAGRLRRRDEDELPACSGEPFDEFGAVGEA